MWYFISKYKNYSLQVTIEEVKHTVNFREIGNFPAVFAGGGIFETDNEDLSDALRAHPKYAGDYEQIAPGKEFTGTDEGPMITFGDSSTEFPPVTPDKTGGIFKYSLPEDGSSFDYGEVAEGDLMWDGSSFSYLKNGSVQYLMTTAEIEPLLVNLNSYILRTTPFTESGGIGSANPIPWANIPSLPFSSFLILTGVLIENLGVSNVSSITVYSQNAVCMSNLTVNSGEKIVFTPSSQKILTDMNGGGGNSCFAVTRPVSSVPLRYTFIVSCIK